MLLNITALKTGHMCADHVGVCYMPMHYTAHAAHAGLVEDGGNGMPDGLLLLQVQVEGSGKWPDNEEAAGKLRAALGCQMAQALEAQFGMHARASEGHVDVHCQGFIVRLQLWSDRDDALAERTARVRGAAP